MAARPGSQVDGPRRWLCSSSEVEPGRPRPSSPRPTVRRFSLCARLRHSLKSMEAACACRNRDCEVGPGRGGGRSARPADRPDPGPFPGVGTSESGQLREVLLARESRSDHCATANIERAARRTGDEGVAATRKALLLRSSRARSGISRWRRQPRSRTFAMPSSSARGSERLAGARARHGPRGTGHDGDGSAAWHASPVATIPQVSSR